MKRICVFCGSNSGLRPEYAETARALGQLLAHEGIGLVYGGASVGLMGLVADAVLSGGGEAIGVLPEMLMNREIAHRGLSDLHVVGSMHERKAKMMELSDGFIAMPGGFGTVEEFFEVLTWAQLGLHAKPTGFLNVLGYYDPLLDWVRRGVQERFVRPQHSETVLEATTPDVLLQAMRSYRPVPVTKWIQEVAET